VLESSRAQKARVKCLNTLAEVEARGSLAEKRFALRDAAAISLLSLIPPDRVGCIRKVGLEASLTPLQHRLRRVCVLPRVFAASPWTHASAYVEWRLQDRPLKAARRSQNFSILRTIRRLAARSLDARAFKVLHGSGA
jgi:hypothetical protein